MTLKQKRLQSAFAFLSRATLCLALCFFGTLAGHTQAMMPRTSQDVTHLELIGGLAAKGGTYVAGIVIAMAPGSHTYWKVPGDAGVPPVFDFTGSQNVHTVQVRYPAPRRIAEEGLEAFGYIDEVVFPVEIVAIDPAKPVVLEADVSYAVCDKLCIPAKGRASINLEPDASGAGAGRIAAALADVPRPATPGERDALSVAREPGAAKPTWTLTWHGAVPVDDIFADVPEGFYLATRKVGSSTWRLVAEQLAPASATVPVTLTLARATHPMAMEEKLDTSGAAR